MKWFLSLCLAFIATFALGFEKEADAGRRSSFQFQSFNHRGADVQLFVGPQRNFRSQQRIFVPQRSRFNGGCRNSDAFFFRF